MRLLLALALFVGLSFSALAQAPASELTPIQTIVENPVDDQRVTIRGEIVRQIDDEDYIVRDASGEIRVEIDDDVLHPRHIRIGMEVEIYGEVDVERNYVEIEAKRVTVLE